MRTPILFLTLLIASNLMSNDSIIAPTLSIVPGGGQYYNNQYIRGSIYSAIGLSFGYGLYYSIDKITQNKDERSNLLNIDPLYINKRNFYSSNIKKYRRERNTYIWLLSATILISAGDAFVSTKFKDFSKKIDEGESVDIKVGLNSISFIYNF